MSKTIIDAINIFSKRQESGFCDDWTPCERLLVYELIRKWNSCARPYKFSESNTELAKNTGFSKPTVIKARKKLIERKYIEYTPTGNSRRAGQYSLEPLFKLKLHEDGGYLEKEQLNQFTTIVKQLNHYQRNSNSGGSKEPAALSEKKKKKNNQPAAPAPSGRGALPAEKNDSNIKKVIAADGRIFYFHKRDHEGGQLVEQICADNIIDSWQFRPCDTDEFIAEILGIRENNK